MRPNKILLRISKGTAVVGRKGMQNIFYMIKGKHKISLIGPSSVIQGCWNEFKARG